MEKIISLFKRNYETDRLVRDEVVEGAEWVMAGEGVATVKLDGTCCMIRDGKLFRRHDVKKGRKQPANFEPAQDPDPATGHWPGWIPVGPGPEDKWHRAALAADPERPDGTYELVGPKIQGNPEGFPDHRLIFHGSTVLQDVPWLFHSLKAYLDNGGIEGIVWHHPDGRMVKIKARDFGVRRSVT